jgi:bifunctional non-homologous end joining protein LigD
MPDQDHRVSGCAFHTDGCPFTDLPNTERKSRWGDGITPEDITTFPWVRPTLVLQVRFVEWTADGHLRHAAFLGVRNDKEAAEVRREG